MKWLVTGEKIDAEGEARGGDGGKYTAATEADAIQQFRDTHTPEKPGVGEWSITATPA